MEIIEITTSMAFNYGITPYIYVAGLFATIFGVFSIISSN